MRHLRVLRPLFVELLQRKSLSDGMAAPRVRHRDLPHFAEPASADALERAEQKLAVLQRRLPHQVLRWRLIAPVWVGLRVTERFLPRRQKKVGVGGRIDALIRNEV